ncbi:prolyl oligopeptidase family serine peptidase [Gaoshiqia sp. Z1-71]|uniref:carboxylesterase family protein n=1 Tax=Gaoshiqia hydrogeniformans TaxID=3290090 RepID=UPI003BF80B7B
MYRIVLVFLLTAFLASSHNQAKALNNDKKVRYNYLTYVPENYDSLKSGPMPVIFYLHGRSASGTDLNRVKRYGLPYFLDKGKKLDFIVVSPQCPWGKNWASENWFDTIYAEINAKYRIDPTRVYLTGMSLGGFGTWELANRLPHKFAAIAPVCGGGSTDWIENLSQLPVWVFHGVKDNQVSVFRADRMVKALKQRQAVVEYSRFPDKGHDIHRVYDDDRLYEWFKLFSARPEQNNLHPLNQIQLTEISNPNLEQEKRKLREITRAGFF